MTQDEREALEGRLRALHGRGEFETLATAALEGYGPEILGLLVALQRDEHAGDEAFARFCADLWVGIEGFAWRSSFRTWAYTLARNASHRVHRDPYRKRGRGFVSGELSAVAARVRNSTRPYLKTEVKDGVARLRERLEPDDQTLLILRVDRAMAWTEIAAIMAREEDGEEAAPIELDEAAIKRRAASLRKRFERVKKRLRGWAEEEGLIPS